MLAELFYAMKQNIWFQQTHLKCLMYHWRSLPCNSWNQWLVPRKNKLAFNLHATASHVSAGAWFVERCAYIIILPYFTLRWGCNKFTMHGCTIGHCYPKLQHTVTWLLICRHSWTSADVFEHVGKSHFLSNVMYQEQIKCQIWRLQGVSCMCT